MPIALPPVSAPPLTPSTPPHPPTQVYGTGCIMGTEVLTQVNVLIMTLIAIGVAVAAYGEVNFVVIGVIEQLSALVFEATRLVLVQARPCSCGPSAIFSTFPCPCVSPRSHLLLSSLFNPSDQPLREPPPLTFSYPTH